MSSGAALVSIPTFTVAEPPPEFAACVSEIRQAVEKLDDLFWGEQLPEQSISQYLQLLAKCYKALDKFDAKEAKLHA